MIEAWAQGMAVEFQTRLRWLLVFLAFAAAFGAHAEIRVPGECGYRSGTIGETIESYLDPLKRDAFAEAYGTYIADLERAKADNDGLVAEVAEYSRTPCKAFTEARDIFARDAAAWNASVCVVGPVTENMVADCQYQESQLKQRQSILMDRLRWLESRKSDFDQRVNDLSARARPALEHAALVLDPDHVEDALRLYVSWLQRERSDSSCRQFAGIAEKLGQRVQNRWLFLELLARNLVTKHGRLNGLIRHATLAPFSFDATGFKARFRTESADNQVRHAVAYMVVGYKYQGTGADLVAQLRDELKGEPQDYWLGVEAGHMGFQLRSGTYDSGNFGRNVRGRLCD